MLKYWRYLANIIHIAGNRAEKTGLNLPNFRSLSICFYPSFLVDCYRYSLNFFTILEGKYQALYRKNSYSISYPRLISFAVIQPTYGGLTITAIPEVAQIFRE